MEGRAVERPGRWTGFRCVLVLSVQVYLGEKAAGLLLNVVELMMGERMQGAGQRGFMPLRAPENVFDLVCRLLLENTN